MRRRRGPLLLLLAFALATGPVTAKPGNGNGNGGDGNGRPPHADADEGPPQEATSGGEDGSAPTVQDPGAIRTVPDDTTLLDPVEDPEARMRTVAELAPSGTAVLATTADFADALASGVLQRDAMLLPATRDRLGVGVAEAIRRHGITSVLVLGGEQAVGPAALAEVPEGVAVTRLAGRERTETAAVIARHAAGGAPVDRVLIARARGAAGNPSSGFVDAIGAGAWAAATGWPILLVDAAGPSPATSAALAALDPDEVVVIGGTAAVSDAAAEALAAGRAVQRLAGPERYTTAATVARAAHPDGAGAVVLVDGDDPAAWAAGFAAAHPAVEEDAAVLLASGTSLPAATAAAVTALGPTRITCLADLQACHAARRAAGFPAPVEVAVAPTPGGALAAGADVSFRAAAEGAAVQVIDDGGCVLPIAADRATATTGTTTEDCTVVLRITAPDRVPQTTTVRWRTVSVEPAVAVGPADYATAEVGNRWDYADAIDARVDPLIGANAGAAAVDTAAGVLHLGGGGGDVTVPLLWAGFPGAVPVAPDGLVIPLDADRYRYLLIRMWTPQESRFGVQWRTCDPAPDADCIMAPLRTGHVGGTTPGGWHTAVLDMRSAGGWSGPIHTLYLTAAGATRIDDVRVVDALSSAAVEIVGHQGTRLEWDTDADPTNNTDPTSARWGVVRDGRLSADLLPPGRYWVHDRGTGRTHGPVALATPPAPRVVSPAPATAPDFATDAGNPWDLMPGIGPAGTDDLAGIGGVLAAAVTPDGVLHATNGGNDPHVLMALRRPLDGSRYHTVTVEFDLSGPLDLSYDAGGGSHGRILYQQGDWRWRDGQDIVAYANQTSYTIDMRRADALEAGAAPWTSAPITALRFDPNEDPGIGRAWTVSGVRVTGDVVAPGTVALAFDDAGVPSGTPATARWYVASGPHGVGQPLTPALPVGEGTTSHMASTCALPGGTYQLRVEVQRDGRTTSTTAPTAVQVTNTGC